MPATRAFAKQLKNPHLCGCAAKKQIPIIKKQIPIINLIARYPDQPLCTLDALHLTLASQAGIPMLATADAVMAETAGLMGFAVERF